MTRWLPSNLTFLSVYLIRGEDKIIKFNKDLIMHTTLLKRADLLTHENSCKHKASVH